MNQDYIILMEKLKKINAYNMALVLFQWDNATAAPKRAIEHTAEAMGILSDAYYRAHYRRRYVRLAASSEQRIRSDPRAACDRFENRRNV